MSSVTDLPKACTVPCSECPWRKTSAPGWLGPMPAGDWIRLASSDEPIACHSTIETDSESGEGDWSHPRMRQCAGAARYRRNVGKLVPNPTDASNHVDADRDKVFSTPMDFIAHHGETLSYSPAPKKPAPSRPVDPREEPCDGCDVNEARWYCTNCDSRHCDPCIDGFDGSRCPSCNQDVWDLLENMEDPFDYDDETW